MNTSSKGKEFIKSFEGLKLKSYKDSGNIYTIGWGHTRTAGPEQIVTEMQANDLFESDINIAEARVKGKVINWQFLKQHEFDCLISLAFNLKSFDKLMAHLNFNREKFLNKIELYVVDSKGNKLQGLIKRRAREKYLFITGKYIKLNEEIV